jgi:hypothetical protein
MNTVSIALFAHNEEASIGAAIDARRRAARALRHPAAVQQPPAAAAFPQVTTARS